MDPKVLQTSGLAASPLLKVVTGNYNHPDDDTELTPEETEAALRVAKHKKAAFLREQDYIKKISQPVVYPVYTLHQIRNGMLKRASQIIPEFIPDVVDDRNQNIFDLLCLYAAADSEFEAKGYSLQKGITLVGPVGCGKTSLMRLFGQNSRNDFGIYSCRAIADEYAKKEGGPDTIRYYSNLFQAYPNDHNGQKEIGLCLDDLGTESTKKHFGNEQNVIEEVLQNRYDNRLIGKTHLTTNLSADQIEAMYGRRVRSRLREMCNIIVFNPAAKDRRG